MQVTVYITDTNDNAPVFNPSAYSVVLTEGQTTQGILVVDVNATDEDQGSNSLVVFSVISGNLGNVFAIENKTVCKLSASPSFSQVYIEVIGFI